MDFTGAILWAQTDPRMQVNVDFYHLLKSIPKYYKNAITIKYTNFSIFVGAYTCVR